LKKALKLLNRLGYGKEGTDLKLELVYNPLGPTLPPDQNQLEIQYKTRLKTERTQLSSCHNFFCELSWF